MQYKHYDLDKIERDIRAMFEQIKHQPRPDNPGDAFMFDRQNEAVELRVASARYLHDMINHGIPDDAQAYVMGVVLADCAADFFLGGYDLSESISPAVAIVNAFVGHINQLLQRERSGASPDASIPIRPVTSGRA